MTPFKSSDDVFIYLRDKYGVDGDGDINAIALFTYALIEKDRIDWVEHYTEQQKKSPIWEEICAWYGEKPRSYVVEKERLAESWYVGFARTYLRDEIEDGKKTAIKGAIGDLGKFWPNFWVGNLVGFTSNFVFAVVVVAFVAVIATDFSFVAWAKKLFGTH